MKQYGIRRLDQHSLNWLLYACSLPNNNLNQCRLLINRTHEKQSSAKFKSKVSFEQNTFENVVRKINTI